MPIIDSIDGENRRIFLSADTVGTSINPIDIYKEMRTLRRTDEDLRKFRLYMSASGNVPKGSGKFTERLVTLLQGTRIVPFNTDHELTITGTIITDDGQEGIAAFDRSTLDLNTSVDINYVPPQVEIIEVVVGGGGVVDLSEVLTAITNLNNFNPASDVVAQVSLVDRTVNLTNGGAGSSPPTPAEIVTALQAVADDFKADLSPISNSINNLNDMDETSIHSALDSYTNKDDFKADVSVFPDADDISDAVWNKLVIDMLVAGSAGERLKKLITLNNFLGFS